MGRRSETGGVRPKGDAIEVRFEYQGSEIRPSLDLKPNAANLKHAARLRAEVVKKIEGGVFVLADYFPNYRYRSKFEKTSGDPKFRTFAQWATLWLELQQRSLETSTIRIYAVHLQAYWLSVWAEMPMRMITHEMLLRRLAELSKPREVDGRNLKALGRKTQNNIMIPLRGIFKLACKADDKLIDPTAGIENLKVESPPPDPFSQTEANLILAALRKPSESTQWAPAMTVDQAEEAADYFEFAMTAGMRSSEQIAVLWEDANTLNWKIKVRRTRVMAEDKQRTKTHKSRTIELCNRSIEILKRQLARTQAAGLDHIFRNPLTCRPWNDDQEQRGIWRSAVVRAGVRYRPPKECRDTSVSQKLMTGADPYWVAAQHGHSVTTMMKDYADYIPDGDKGRNLERVNRAQTEVGEAG